MVEAKYSDEAKQTTLITAGLGSALGTGAGVVTGAGMMEGTPFWIMNGIFVRDPWHPHIPRAGTWRPKLHCSKTRIRRGE
jgi:hypothetical protein